MDGIRVVIVDDDLDWLKSMTSFLNQCDDILVVGTAMDRTEAVKLSRTFAFDVMLLDINLQGNKLDGIYAAMDILSVTDARIIMLTSLSGAEIVTQSFAAGAVNFIAKDDFMEIPNAIRGAMKNNIPLEALLKEFRRLKKVEQLQVLTPSELEIFKLAEQGYKRTEICDRLCKSENTIKKQIKLILLKLDASNIKEAVQKINLKGIISKED